MAHNHVAWALVKKPDSQRSRAERGARARARGGPSLAPSDGNFRTTLALAEYRAGHWAESIAAAERSIALTKGVDALQLVLPGDGRWQKGDKDEARKWFDKAVTWTKQDPKNVGSAPVLV